MNTENQRADFEAWLRVKPCGAAHDFAWEAWQAAIASPDVQALRDALEMIAGIRSCPNNLLGNVDIALMALEKQK